MMSTRRAIALDSNTVGLTGRFNISGSQASVQTGSAAQSLGTQCDLVVSFESEVIADMTLSSPQQPTNSRPCLEIRQGSDRRR